MGSTVVTLDPQFTFATIFPFATSFGFATVEVAQPNDCPVRHIAGRQNRSEALFNACPKFTGFLDITWIYLVDKHPVNKNLTRGLMNAWPTVRMGVLLQMWRSEKILLTRCRKEMHRFELKPFRTVVDLADRSFLGQSFAG